MAQPQRRARFFVAPDGAVVERARPLTPAQRRAVFRRDGYRCCHCGQRVSWTRHESRHLLAGTRPGAVDHLIPRARGGQNGQDNLVLACERCNASKGAR